LQSPTIKLVNLLGEYDGAASPFMMTVHTAYCYHLPLLLSPDVIWNLIAQSVANHVNENSKALRTKFVKHEEKATLLIRRDEFVLGSPSNDWEGCFDEFSAKIKSHIGEENHSMIVADFSTTTSVEKACSEIVLMEAMKSFF